MRTITEEKERTMDKQIKDLKQEMNKEKSSATERLYSVDKEKMEMTLRVEKLQEEIQLLTRDKENEGHRLN